MELGDGGDLYTRLPYSEEQAASIVLKVLSAIKYMVRFLQKSLPRDMYEIIMQQNLLTRVYHSVATTPTA